MKQCMRCWAVLLFLAAAAVSAATAGESAYTARAVEMRRAPLSDAEVVANLPQGAKLTLLKRQGAWAQVKGEGGSTGWVRMLSLRQGEGGDTGGTGETGITSLLNVARTGTSGATVTTGVRGLDKEQIRNAQPNPEALKTLAGYAASTDEARRFAAGKPALRAQAVDYLPEAAP